MSLDPSFRLTSSLVIPQASDSLFWYVLNKKDGKWGLPGGKVELFEHLPNAGAREAQEELGCMALTQYHIGTYYFRSEHGNPVINFVYAATLSGGAPHADLQSNILEVKAFSLSELEDLLRRGSLRANEANLAPVQDYLRGNKFPLDFIKTFF